MLNHKIKLAVLSALVLPAITFAADPVITMPETKAISTVAAPEVAVKDSAHVKPVMNVSSSAKEIADINERLAVLNARFAELEMQSKIATKKSEINKVKNPNDFNVEFVPSVAFIDGVDGNLKAVLYVEGGNTQSVSVGDKVGGWKVKGIKMDSVTVQKGKEVRHLGFGSYTNSDQTNLPSGQLVPQL